MYGVLTLKEVSNFWGFSMSKVHRDIVGLHERSEEGADMVRKSGGTWLVDVKLVHKIYGRPQSK